MKTTLHKYHASQALQNVEAFLIRSGLRVGYVVENIGLQ